jgi:transposase InsO family protein
MGEISLAVPNLLKRSFHAAVPGAKLLTDITEFVLSYGKPCLLPIMDCYDGRILTYPASTYTGAARDTLLIQLKTALSEGVRPIIHSDQRYHYQYEYLIV